MKIFVYETGKGKKFDVSINLNEEYIKNVLSGDVENRYWFIDFKFKENDLNSLLSRIYDKEGKILNLFQKEFKTSELIENELVRAKQFIFKAGFSSYKMDFFNFYWDALEVRNFYCLFGFQASEEDIVKNILEFYKKVDYNWTSDIDFAFEIIKNRIDCHIQDEYYDVALDYLSTEKSFDAQKIIVSVLSETMVFKKILSGRVSCEKFSDVLKEVSLLDYNKLINFVNKHFGTLFNDLSKIVFKGSFEDITLYGENNRFNEIRDKVIKESKKKSLNDHIKFSNEKVIEAKEQKDLEMKEFLERFKYIFSPEDNKTVDASFELNGFELKK